MVSFIVINEKAKLELIVLILLGSGGVGRNLALNFCRLGSRVIIWDINREGETQPVFL